MFILNIASDLKTRTTRWVWNNREEGAIIILKTHEVQGFVDRLYNINHG